LGNRLFSKEIDLVNDLNLGAVKIDETIVLEEVAVTGRRGLIERKVDRLVYNIENSIVSQGVNGLEALKNTPLVRIQNENISIAGKGSVSVIINDRMINLSQAELANYLQSLRSDNIAKIEVITAAPIKI
ncbi:MAG: TonB-dependent receptor, partial [Sphingobacterium sp.]